MSGRFISALSFSLVVHAAIWTGVFSRGLPELSHPKKDRFENSIMVEATPIEKIRKTPPLQTLPERQTASKSAPKPEPRPLASQPPAPPAQKAVPRPSAPSTALKIRSGSKTSDHPVPANIPAAQSNSREVSLQKTGSDLMANPQTRTLFADYFGLLKSRIQEKLRERCAGRRLGRGSVEMAFVLTSDGRLGQVSVMGQDGAVQPILKQMAIQALRDSSPFFAFPPEFKTRQIAFNLTVYFDGLAS